jgi:hypothetical protein
LNHRNRKCCFYSLFAFGEEGNSIEVGQQQPIIMKSCFVSEQCKHDLFSPSDCSKTLRNNHLYILAKRFHVLAAYSKGRISPPVLIQNVLITVVLLSTLPTRVSSERMSPGRHYSASLREPNGLNWPLARKKIPSKLGRTSPYIGL